MSRYKFTTDEFGVSETGIHLLRSNFNYETIDYRDIISLEIDKGKLIRNWILVLLIGIGFITFAVYYIAGLVAVFNDDSIRSIYIEEIVIPVLPLLMGGFCVFSSVRSGVIIRIDRNGKKISYPLTRLVKRNELKEFISYLRANKSVDARLKVYIEE